MNHVIGFVCTLQMGSLPVKREVISFWQWAMGHNGSKLTSGPVLVWGWSLASTAVGTQSNIHGLIILGLRIGDFGDQNLMTQQAAVTEVSHKQKHRCLGRTKGGVLTCADHFVWTINEKNANKPLKDCFGPSQKVLVF